MADLNDSLRSLLASIEAGELVASVSMRHRLEGALAALDAVLGRAPADVSLIVDDEQ